MATLNKKRTADPVFTHEGARAHRITADAQLRRTLMACLLWEDTFYEDGVSIADRIREHVAAVRPEVAAALAIEAREQMHLRHVPLLVVREMARRGGSVVGDTLARVIQRPDELSEFLAIYWQDGRKMLTSQIKRGLSEAFRKFDAYQLAKYDRPREIKLRDVLFLCHAEPRDEEQAALWKQLVDGTLPPPDTWEVGLSGGGDKAETFRRLMAENKLGGMALLRNLRNMREAGIPDAEIREGIAAASFRRVLPFRFIAAARYVPTLEPALEEAMFRATAEMPKLPGRTALLLDNSGSMHCRLSAKSDMMRTDAAGGLGMLMREVCEDVVVIGFGTHADILPSRRGFALADAYRRGPGGGTNTENAKRLADAQGYDRIVILTDEQSHQMISDPAGAATGYVVNLSSYQNGIGYGRWTHIDGWSEAVVRYIQETENEEVDQ